MKRLALLVGLTLSVSASVPAVRAQTAAQPNAPATSLPSVAGVTAASYPRLNGSTSTIPLAQLLLARVMGLNAELRRVPPQPWARTEPTLSLSFTRDTPHAQLEEFARLQLANRHVGTHESYESLINGEANLILVARLPSADENRLAAEKKVTLQAKPIARDALVFLVNRENTVRSLKSDQLRAIYEGKITNWKEVGGADKPIRAFTRDRNSGSEELMRALLQKETPFIEGGDRMVATMAGLIDGMARNPQALGYSVFYYESVMNPRLENARVAVDGVLPTPAAIADGTYPLLSPIYAVTRGDAAPDSPAVRLRDWLQSEDGQELVAASGNVPFTGGQ